MPSQQLEGEAVQALLHLALQKGLDSSVEPGCWRSKGVFPWCQACGSVQSSFYHCPASFLQDLEAL